MKRRWSQQRVEEGGILATSLLDTSPAFGSEPHLGLRNMI